MSRVHLLQTSTTADRAWMAEVAEVFGTPNAGLARFDGRAMGERGSKLRGLYDAYIAARDVYEAN